jgi:hypothetical protein
MKTIILAFVLLTGLSGILALAGPAVSSSQPGGLPQGQNPPPQIIANPAVPTNGFAFANTNLLNGTNGENGGAFGGNNMNGMTNAGNGNPYNPYATYTNPYANYTNPNFTNVNKYANYSNPYAADNGSGYVSNTFAGTNWANNNTNVSNISTNQHHWWKWW